MVKGFSTPTRPSPSPGSSGPPDIKKKRKIAKQKKKKQNKKNVKFGKNLILRFDQIAGEDQ